MKLLSKTQILSAKDLVTEDVPTPEWAPEDTPPEQRAEFGVRVRNLTGTGRGVFIQRSIEMKKAEESKEKVDFEIEMLLVAMTAVDENNEPIFSEADVAELGKKNANPIARLAAVAQRLSALDKAAQDAVAKNSKPAAS